MRTATLSIAILLYCSTPVLAQTCEADLAMCRQQLEDSEELVSFYVDRTFQLSAEVLELEGFRDAYFNETYDADRDGLADRLDKCPLTDEDRTVDADGCSLAQFCNALPIETVRDRQTCRRLDWKNDEPRSANPDDCRFDAGACTAAVAEPRGTDCTNVLVRVNVSYAGLAAGISARVGYPPDAVVIPGFGGAALPRITNLTGIDSGLFNGADNDVNGDGLDDEVTASLISISELIEPGPFVTILFDCAAPETFPDVRRFSCTSDVASYAGDTLSSSCAVEFLPR